MAVASEEDLRLLSKQFGTVIPKEEPVLEDDIQQLENTLLWLLDATEFPQLGLTHRAAACNALCGFLDAASGSNIPQVRLVTLNPAIWSRLLSFYFDRYQDASPRSTRQLLSTMTKLIRVHQDTNVGTSKWAEDVGSKCIRSISSYSDLSSLKPSILCLEDLLSKNLIPWIEFLELLGTAQQELSLVSVTTSPTSFRDQRSPNLALHQVIADILRWCKYADVASIAGRLLKLFFAKDKHEIGLLKLAAEKHEPIWLPPLLTVARDDFTEAEKLGRHILPQLLANDEENLIYLIQQFPIRQLLSGTSGGIKEVDIRFSISLISIMRAMKLSTAIVTQIQLYTQAPFKELQEKLALSCLQHQSPDIRVRAMNLIVTADRTVQLFTEDILMQLRPVLKALFLESNAKVRGDFANILKRLIGRLCLVMNKLKKTLETEPQSTNNSEADHTIKQNSLKQHTDFVSWFYEFLCEGLCPSASYQRHIMSLKALNMASTSALFSVCRINLFSSTMITQLAALALDAFDDVRDSAAILLTCAAPLDDCLFDPANETSLISIAKARMIATGRASISDGYARLMELSYHTTKMQSEQKFSQCHAAQILLKDIHQGLEAAQYNFIEAVKHPQLHGHFIALRYTVLSPNLLQFFKSEEDWAIFKDEIIEYCGRAWEVVKPILCIDSPEGHSDEEDLQDIEIGIKDTLSYSWRTLKEASALLQALVESKSHSLTFEETKKIGDLCFTQLAELRHRGAFSTVAQCFTSCCVGNGHQMGKGGCSLVESWYRQLLSLIDAKSTALTRRSAGLPAMITAILAANVKNTFIDMVFKDLQSIAYRDTTTEHRHGETGLPQVHAMNCLKAIFASSRLSYIAERYLEDTLQLAVQSLDHDIWSIRNCGGMLLKAILSRLNSAIGVTSQEARGNFAKSMYRKYPSLATTVESLLQTSVSYRDTSFAEQANRQVNNGFPALAIIDQVGIQEGQALIVQSLLFELLNSPIWVVRERAADSISQLVGSSIILVAIHGFLEPKLEKGISRTNGLHGRLLCLKASLKRRLPGAPYSFLLQLLDEFESLSSMPCRFISTTYFDVLALVLEDLLSGNVVSDNAMLEKDALDRITQFTIVLEKYMAKEEIVNASSHRLHVFLRMWVYKFRVGQQVSAPCISINEHNAGFVAQALIGQDSKVFWDWINWLPGLFDACIELIKTDSEGPLALQTVEQLTNLLTKSHVVTHMKNEQMKTTREDTETSWIKPMVQLLSECEVLVRKGRTISGAALELYGALLPICQRGPLFETQCSKCIKEIRCALNDEMDASRRLSAVKALYNARQIVHRYCWSLDNNQLQKDISMLIGNLFDGLVDDDEDVRNLTAEAVAYAMFDHTDEACSLPSLNPIAAQDILLEYTKGHGASSTALFSEFLARLIDLEVLSGSPLMSKWVNGLTNKPKISKTPEISLFWPGDEEAGPVAQAIQRALAEDNTLFEIERQNLYKDNVQQMQLWADILMSMPCHSVTLYTHAEAYHKAADLSTFCQWTVSGLEKIAQSSGSVGWAHGQEGFEVICETLILAQVVLSWNPPRHSLVQLKAAVFAIESHLHPAHGQHVKMIDNLKFQFEQMSYRELDQKSRS